MKEWTDEDVATGLVATFRIHSADIDPDNAQRIALTTPRAPGPRWRATVTAALVAVAVLVAIGAYAIHASGPGRSPAATQTSAAGPDSPQPPVTNPVEAGANRTAAASAAARAFKRVPVPPGSTRTSSTPKSRWLRHLGCQCGEVDETLTRTGWWTVPLSYPNMLRWYETHTPANTSGSYYDIAKTEPSPHGELDWSTTTRSAAYSTPEIVITYVRLDAATTALRVDVTLAARYERTAQTVVPPTVTSIEITRSAQSGDAASAHLDKTISDPATVATVVNAFNNLNGAYAHTLHTPCGSPAGTTYLYAVTFTWPGHILANDPGSPLCGIGRGLNLNGTTLPTTLDGTVAFDNVLRDALGMTSSPPTTG